MFFSNSQIQDHSHSQLHKRIKANTSFNGTLRFSANENPSTLIDHHYCSHLEHVLSITSPAFGLSDHNPTILVRKQNANLKSTKKAHFTVTYRPLNNLNVSSLIKDLK